MQFKMNNLLDLFVYILSTEYLLEANLDGNYYNPNFEILQ